ncbi:MAG: hypothetical protein ACE37B_13720 [Ilumatobacter sp.]|uniref:hypothetical protein n=1 Tax=Ilumatobacter sp. TaxID=1967498 RepID=UPI00391CCD51
MAVDLGGTIEVRTRYNGVTISEGGSGGPRCSWRQFSMGEYEDFHDISVVLNEPPLPDVPALPTAREPTAQELAEHDQAQEAYDLEVERRAEAARLEQLRRAQPTNIPWRQAGEVIPHAFYSVYCPGAAAEFVYVAIDTDATVLLDELEGLMRGRIPSPQPDVSPSVEAGGIVNLGMWLAIAPPVVPSRLTAEAGPRWVTMTAAHSVTSFEMGTGDVVVCDGSGDPIVDLDTVEASPVCGYTYRQPSPAGVGFVLSISSEWVLPWVSSSGSGVLSHTQTVAFDYDVDEVQTVGRG